jgi:hypothetical protein
MKELLQVESTTHPFVHQVGPSRKLGHGNFFPVIYPSVLPGSEHRAASNISMHELSSIRAGPATEAASGSVGFDSLPNACAGVAWRQELKDRSGPGLARRPSLKTPVCAAGLSDRHHMPAHTRNDQHMASLADADGWMDGRTDARTHPQHTMPVPRLPFS